MNAINDFMMGKYFVIRLYESYLQGPVRFVDFLTNLYDETYFFKESTLYIYYLLLIISLFFKVYIFPQVLQICYFTSYILRCFDFV